MYSDVDQLKNKKILIVEDDEMLGNGLKSILQIQKYETYLVCSVKEAMEFFSNHEPDLCILDLWLPDGNGFDLCRWIRKKSEMPVLFLTACEDESKTVEGLKCGGDDYVVKPFYMGELLARIRVAKRLSKKEDEEIKKYQKDYLDVDFISRKVLIDQEEIHLTPIEFNLLKLLIEHRGKVLTHNYIQKEIWGYQDHSNQNALRVFMATLRRKIEKDTNHPHFIVTEVGVGYYFKD